MNYLNLSPGSAPLVVKVSEGDIGREINFTLVEDGVPYTIPTGSTITCEILKSDGHGTSIPCTWSGSVVTFETTEQSTIRAGKATAELRIAKGSDDIGTANFIIAVEPRPINADTDQTDSSYSQTGDAGDVWTLGSNGTPSWAPSGLDATSATAGQAPIADGAGGWQWGNVQGGISTESANLLCNILGECLTGTDQTANIASLRAMLTGSEPSPDPPVTTAYIVTNNLTNVSSSNSAPSVNSGSPYSATLTGDSGYLLTDATVTMGGTDITASAVSSTGRNTLNISIASVTGAVVITATAEADEPVVTTETLTADHTFKGTENTWYTDGGNTSATADTDYPNRSSGSSIYYGDTTFNADTEITVKFTPSANISSSVAKVYVACFTEYDPDSTGNVFHYAQRLRASGAMTAGVEYEIGTYTVKAGYKVAVSTYTVSTGGTATITY